MEILKTNRLALRNWAPADLDEVYDYRNDERCSRYQRGQIRDRSGIEAMIGEHGADDLSSDGTKRFAVALRETDALVGEVTAFLENPTITLGYTVSYKHHRKGYAFEALSAIIDELHGRYPEREVICLVDPENAASIALLKKLEFEDLGYAEKITSQVYGKWPIPE